MPDLPILFSGSMVRALIDGRKTMTRRILKPQPIATGTTVLGDTTICNADWQSRTMRPCPIKYNVDDRLWVREAWQTEREFDQYSPSTIEDMCHAAGYKKPWCPIRYDADGALANWDGGAFHGRTRASMHMPRWASRLTLVVTGVKIERLQDISEADAKAEGAEPILVPPDGGSCPRIEGFRELWQSINGPSSWEANLWVAAYTFEVKHCNIDNIKV